MGVKKIVFGLGSNLGQKEANLGLACNELVSSLKLTSLKRSKVFKNPALLLPNSPPEWNLEFFNIAVSADIDCALFEPLKILEVIKNIEKKLGRADRPRWSPREIDIDILALGFDQIRLEQDLIIPHQGLFARDFFLETFREIEPDFLENLQAQRFSGR